MYHNTMLLKGIMWFDAISYATLITISVMQYKQQIGTPQENPHIHTSMESVVVT